MSGTSAAERAPLTRDRALRAAIDLADAEGIDAVTMRKLATHLGVTPMAFYKHVSNKDELLDGMVDTVVADYAEPEPGLPWRDEVRARILAAREAVLKHTWARELIESRTRRTPTVLAHMNAMSGAFINGGVSLDLTHHAMHALGYRIWGFSPEAFENGAVEGMPTDPAEVEAFMLQAASVFPHIVAIAMSTPEKCDEQFEFEFTLDLLLDAFEKLHASGWASR